MIRLPLAIVAGVMVLLVPQVRGAEKPTGEKSAYNPESFTISYWCGPPAAFLTPERFAEVKEANFTLAFPSCGGMTVEQNRKMLDYCQENGLQAMIADSRMVVSIDGSAEKRKALDAIVADYSDHPALLGYHIVDEPGAAAFPGLGEVVAHLKEKDPRHPGFINLLPTYARDNPGMLGTATYEEHVRKYVEQVKPFVISYDHYHFTNEGDRADFFENLDTIRKVSLESRIPFWNIVLVTQHFGYRHLTEAELRFEAMQTLAFGGRGLLWFTYWMPAGVPEPEGWKHSMINADGTRDPHYDMVKRVNAEAKAIGDILATAESTAVFHHGEGATLKSADSPITALDGQLTVGAFRSRDGKNLAMVTSRNYKEQTRARVLIQPPNAAVEVFEPAAKTWSPATIGERGVVHLELPAAGGALLRW